ncbi:deferrochelatase/peroxidase EfeB [Paenibacillus cellulosilyticus]|uniref:Deferrochelatase n=1 Tax=Paenibacillus cellulosilyticus TaxID=375489 RepID=A0A2V2YM32_9BACL|nr:iron uptake transporter deferrochelatase/peroxidase subunit [Paenibacillus cellulosilyticus]PWV94276.1 deferrochelatase/peroxidase EfeB [Paenibacillus cellulosilyticus]QKS44240.1 deferrochelatase/peroxidase EfeB [Paenibacillus cellulosilyticus]
MTANRKEDKNSREGGISRRDLLKMAGIGGAGLLLGGAGVGALFKSSSSGSVSASASPTNSSYHEEIPFYGQHQAGIVTPAQDFIVFASFDVTAASVDEVRQLFKDWTAAAAVITQGGMLGEDNENLNVPPSDTGEAAGLQPSKTTLTFGVGPSFFDGRFGLADRKPAELQDLPAFSGDALRSEWMGGDIGVQACANDMQVAFRAIRNLARIARGKAALRWTQEGFQRTGGSDPSGGTARNLMGFKDGTGNPDVTDEAKMNEVVWTQASDGPQWMAGGSYMVVRRIRIRVEVWDRSTLGDQEATFGRYRTSGAPLGGEKEFDAIDLDRKDEKGKPVIPIGAHIRVAKENGVQILRRSFSYSSGLDTRTGQLDAGLLFVAFNRNVAKQFIPMQRTLAASDRLNEYIEHNGSALFACFPGVKEGGYIGDTLL